MAREREDFNREYVLQALQGKRWVELIRLFKDNEIYEAVCDDPLLRPVVDQYFISELLSNEDMDDEFKVNLEQFLQLHESKQFKFTFNRSDYQTLVRKVVEKSSGIYAYNYAKKLPNDPYCRSIISQFEAALPTAVSHSQEGRVSVKVNKEEKNIDARISLFKSKAELLLYRAVKDVFPNYFVLPNVALNAVLDFEAIREKLTLEEKEYFFKALIDCVVVDTDQGFKAKMFFELDSVFHDTQEGHRKDALKDRILTVSGQQLFRLRPAGQAAHLDFARLIQDVLKSQVRE